MLGNPAPCTLRRVRWPLRLSVAALLGLALPLGIRMADADAAKSRADIMPLSQVKPGMKGYGLTVFEGTTPSRFDVEVIDVLHNFRPGTDMILIKTAHPRLEAAKVVAGMSGSPIYIDGKMIGAYAFGWTFGAEPVAGVTPIESMLEELDRPLPATIHGWPLLGDGPSAARGGHGRSAAAVPYDVAEHSAKLAAARALPTAAPLTPVSTPLLFGGVEGSALELAKRLYAPLGLEPLQAGGGGGGVEADAPKRYVDGGAIGVSLIDGDMSATGLGTVTRVEGDRLVAFGHPMMQSGATSMPTSVGRIIWFLASSQRSFKLGMPVRPLGAMINDRSNSIVVDQNAKAPTVDFALHIAGLPVATKADWHFAVAQEKFMTPSLLAVALGSALQTVASERQDVTWTARSQVVVRGYGTVTLEDYGLSVGGTPDASELQTTNLVRGVGAFLNNPWEEVRIESVKTELQMHFSRDVLRLRGLEVLTPEVDAGQSARLRLHLVPFAGPETTRVVEVPIPAQLAGETVSLQVKPGYNEERDAAPPENLAELIQIAADPTYPPQSIVVSFRNGDPAVVHHRWVSHSLPAGALDLLESSSSSAAPMVFRDEVRVVDRTPFFIIGEDVARVRVKPVLR